MKPDLENSRSFAMTLAHRAVRDVRRDGFRQLRNYVDMCALLAQRPDLKRFFDHAQTVLQRTDSLYYKLINNLVAQVNEDAICTAGINLGFDAIISCASNNRKQNGETRSWLNVGFCIMNITTITSTKSMPDRSPLYRYFRTSRTTKLVFPLSLHKVRNYTSSINNVFFFSAQEKREHDNHTTHRPDIFPVLFS